MDKCPCMFMSDGRWRLSATRIRCPQHETDRRTSRPSTGGASILRRDAGRRRSRQQLPDGGPQNAGQLKNNRISNRFAALAARAWGRRAASRYLGVGGDRWWRLARRAPAAALMHFRRRGPAPLAVMQLGCISSGGGGPEDVELSSFDAAEVHHGPDPSARPIGMHHRGGRRDTGGATRKHDGFRQVRAPHYGHVQHRTGTHHPGGTRAGDPGRAAASSAAGHE